MTASPLPTLTHAQVPLTCAISAVNQYGEPQQVAIPAERALTLYVDRRELVTLMTLGARPELLVLGYLYNQRLIGSVGDVESVTVDWDVGAAAVKTRHGIADIEARTATRVVTTGCGQGSVFGELMGDIGNVVLPPGRVTQAQLYSIVNSIRLQDSTYKSAGSVHACALFQGERMLVFVEDVGRHNAIGTIAGWMGMQAGQSIAGGDKVFYTTGRLTSEMVIKCAQMGIPFLLSRSGLTHMGHEIAKKVGITMIGRCQGKHYLLFTGSERFVKLHETLIA